ncbi:MAG: hypothetical protein HOO67_00440 [Candidatus Peribacteraceae bacterium]|nr:hypothetical protein [Candidatus Peribacteraceae bacterium]
MAKKESTDIDGDGDCDLEIIRIPTGDLDTYFHTAVLENLVKKMMRLRQIMGQSNDTRDITKDSLKESQPVGNGVWQADTDLFMTDWSTQYVHGGDTLLPVGIFVERLLRDGEKLTAMDSVRWQSIIRENMRITASFDAFKPEQTAESLMTATLSTSEDRKLHVKGDGNGEPIHRSSARNPVADKMFQHSRHRVKVNKAGWNEFPLGQCENLSGYSAERPGMQMSTVIDLLNCAAVASEESKKYAGGGGLFLGVQNFSLPEISAVARVRVKFHHDAVKPTKKRFNTLPVQVEFIDAGRTVIGGGMSYFAFPQDQRALDELAEELRRTGKM